MRQRYSAPVFTRLMLDSALKHAFIGPEGVKHYKNRPVREWVDAAVFAIVAATLIRTFVLEAYTIPTRRWKNRYW